MGIFIVSSLEPLPGFGRVLGIREWSQRSSPRSSGHSNAGSHHLVAQVVGLMKDFLDPTKITLSHCTLIRVYILLFSAAEWGAGWVRAPEGWNAIRNLLHESFPTRDEIWVGDRVPETVWETVDEGVTFNWPETRQQLNTRSILRLE